ncbi:phage major capsid protein [Butyrivibrio sp. MB2005]|uniref:phage major capsid protein n=1 Tax=Butyrivibrio sp. MB2005 TaxID=1280678 RepID=UPI0004212FED|nr:phage major capsid protein [Butyrivibrio sp. MB2005]
MSKILELMEKRAKAWNAAKEFLDTHSDNGSMVSAEDAATYDRMEKEVTDLTKDIERLQRQEQIDKMMNMPTSEPITGKPGKAGDVSDEKVGTASNAYKKVFWDNIRKRNYYDVEDVLSVGTDANGGYLVPDEYERKLLDTLQDENFFRHIAHVIRTNNGTHTIPVVASHGTAAWMDENGLYPESEDTFDQVTLDAYKLGTAIKVSEELMNDSVFDLESYIATEFARRIGAAEEEAFLVGDGKKKPEGVFTKVTAGKAVTEIADATKFSFDDIMDLFHSLRSVYRNKAQFILNDTTIKAIRKIKDNNGTYIWQPSVQVGQPDTILNRPYKTSIYAPELAAGKTAILFGDFSYYWIADRKGRSFKRLNELYAANGQIGFLASERVDGKLILPEAVKGLSVKAKG